MNKYPFLIIAVLCIVVLASGCVSNNNTNKTKTYSQNGIYFIYNGTWQEANITSDVPNAVVAVGDPSNVNPNTHQPLTFVLIQKVNGTDLQTAYNQNYATFFNNTTNQRVSEANITVNNNHAYENVYIATSGGVQREMRAVWMQQNGMIYVILCGTLPADFQNEQKNFDLVVNSFKVQ